MKNVDKLVTLLKEGAEKLAISLNEQQLTQLSDYIQTLIKWNRVYNLTAIEEPERIVTHHILDSLSIISHISGERILDVGSGAGLPGIPCAIVLTEKHFTLLDSNGKKTRFMTQAIAEIKLRNANVVQARAENYHPEQCFDVVMARALASIDKVWRLTKHLVCPHDGKLLLMKGADPQAELQNLSNHAKVYKLSVPGIHEARHIVSIKGF